MSVSPVTYRARWIFPISRPPIRDGWVTAVGDRILALSAGDRFPEQVPVVDLGERTILPGLINAHTHLEFSHLARPLGYSGIPLEEWVAEVIRDRQRADVDRSRSIRQGAEEARQSGTRLICEIATLPWQGLSGDLATEVIAMGEVLGLSEARASERLAAATEHLRSVHGRSGVVGGVSPHAPYSTSMETLRRSVEIATRAGVGVAMHIAESEAERELIERGCGPMAERLIEMGVFRSECFGPGTPNLLDRLSLLAHAPYALIIHGHELRQPEIDRICQHPNLTLVYCPRTQAFFGHRPRGFDAMWRRGGRIALGTDSRASNPDLSIWGELCWLWSHRSELDWQAVLRMGTVAGADAVQRPDLGRIEPGGLGGLIAVDGAADHPEGLVARWIESGPPEALTPLGKSAAGDLASALPSVCPTTPDQES